ncbi:MAG: SDR family NAD(P)-dependent oxidoreductase [Candidatus Humimicrobiaceae bacterium]
MNLKGKVVLVTGASKGIGRNISMNMAKEGAVTVLASRNKGELENTKEEIMSSGGLAFSIPADVSKEKEVSDLFAKIKSEFGKLDVLINNAGIIITGRMTDFSLKDYDIMMQTNLRGLYVCCQEALKLMLPQKRGFIINMSSVAGIKGYEGQSAYTASKHGVIGITKSLAAEVYRDGICVSAILPGGVDTELAWYARPDIDRSKLISPQDISDTVLYLLHLSDTAWVDQIYIHRKNAQPF